MSVGQLSRTGRKLRPVPTVEDGATRTLGDHLGTSRNEVFDNYACISCNFTLEHVGISPSLSGCFCKVGNGGFFGWLETNDRMVSKVRNFNFRNTRPLGKRLDHRSTEQRMRQGCD
jgi:hypothetical protein